MKAVLIIDSYSAIAEETAKLYTAQGNRLALWGRSLDRLKRIQKNLEVLGAKEVFCFEIDLDDCAKHSAVLQKTVAKTGPLDTALIAHGVLPDQ